MYLSEKAKGVKASTTLAIDSKFKAMRAEGINVVGFGAGEPDFDTPTYIQEAAISAIREGKTKYTPAAGTMELRKAVAEKFLRENGLSYEPSQIVVSNGAKHSLVNAFTAILNPGDEVVIPAPFWVSYPEMVKLADGVPVVVETREENNFKVKIEDLEAVLTDKTRAIVLNSPSNPTGMVYDEEELLAIANFVIRHDLYIISDEIYEHLIYEGKHVSIASLGEEIKARTIIINGVSKTYAMTGWRIGFAAAPTEIAKVMANVQSHASSNPNSIAQAATVAALSGGREEIETMKKAFRERRDYMVDRINAICGVSCRKPQGAFYVLMNISGLKGSELAGKKIETSDDFAEVLLQEAKVAVVPCSGFGADDFVRWSYAVSMDTIREGIDRLEKFLKSNGI
ncbi:MAG: pyridoxal phosphate-dependent aminotransferase [Ruminococcaceae bacterium]|nr:pyridoxal phosphate-dependent aminotransferase [Oscillospiraceae bacterium]